MHADDGRGSLRDRLPAPEPPAELAQHVKRTLETRLLITPLHSTQSRPRPWVARLGYLAAGLLLGFAARGALGTTSSRPAAAPTAGQYVLLLYGDPPDDTGAVHAAREREYGRWASALTDGARWVGGSELADVVARLGPADSAKAVSDDRLAGYFVIQASSRERATEVARSCPHLRYGGRVVVMALAG